jgi:hypothetical protein
MLVADTMNVLKLPFTHVMQSCDSTLMAVNILLRPRNMVLSQNMHVLYNHVTF